MSHKQYKQGEQENTILQTIEKDAKRERDGWTGRAPLSIMTHMLWLHNQSGAKLSDNIRYDLPAALGTFRNIICETLDLTRRCY